MRVTKSVFSSVFLMAQCLWPHCTCGFEAISCLGPTWSWSPAAAVSADWGHFKFFKTNFSCIPIF